MEPCSFRRPQRPQSPKKRGPLWRGCAHISGDGTMWGVHCGQLCLQKLPCHPHLPLSNWSPDLKTPPITASRSVTCKQHEASWAQPNCRRAQAFDSECNAGFERVMYGILRKPMQDLNEGSRSLIEARHGKTMHDRDFARTFENRRECLEEPGMIMQILYMLDWVPLKSSKALSYEGWLSKNHTHAAEGDPKSGFLKASSFVCVCVSGNQTSDFRR